MGLTELYIGIKLKIISTDRVFYEPCYDYDQPHNNGIGKGGPI